MKDTNARQQYTTLANTDHMPTFDAGSGEIGYYNIAPIYAEGFAKGVNIPSGGKKNSTDNKYYVQLVIDGSNVYPQSFVDGSLNNSDQNPLQITFREVDYCTVDGKKYKMIVLCSEAYEDQSEL